VNLSSENLLGKMDLFSNMDFDLHFLCGFDDFIAMFLDLSSTMISGMFTNSADFLNKFLDMFSSFCFVTFQTFCAANFDIIILTISDGLSSSVDGGAMMSCFDFASTSFQSFLGLCLDLLVEFVN